MLGFPLLEGEGQGEVWDLFGEFTTLTPTLSQTGEGARRASCRTLMGRDTSVEQMCVSCRATALRPSPAGDPGIEGVAEAVTEALGELQDTAVASDLIAQVARGASADPGTGVWRVLRDAQADRRAAALVEGRQALAVVLDGA